MKRKQFIRSLGLLTISSSIVRNNPIKPEQDEPQLDKSLVLEFVGAAHKDMDKVKSLLQEHPTLLNSAHDWETGDFETGLGAASHMGYKELVHYFIEQGAQVNLFTAALFGRIDILKPILDFFPHALHAKGPHGYSLLHHAQQGGEKAAELREYLVYLGAKEEIYKLF